MNRENSQSVIKNLQAISATFAKDTAERQTRRELCCEKLGHFFVVDINDLDKTNLAKLLIIISKNYLRIKKLFLNKKIILNKQGLSKTLKLCKL